MRLSLFVPGLSLYSLFVSLVSSHTYSRKEEAAETWPTLRGVASFLQLAGVDALAGFATLGTAMLPPHLQGMAGPAVQIATAKANAKQGISNVFTGGEDYAWVCTCDAFPGYARTEENPKKCPYDKELGCYNTNTTRAR